VQLIRAHYAGSESAFLGAAESLARSCKVVHARTQLEDEIRVGRRAVEQRRRAEYAKHESERRPAMPSLTSEFLTPVQPMSFAELLLPGHVQETMNELHIELIYSKHLAERGLRARSRFLFHGPPGNGKTSCAAALAQALSVSGYVVSLAELVSKFLGGTGANLGSVMKALNAGTLVVFDEIDAIGAARGGGGGEGGREQNAVVNTLLTLLDANREGVLCATTNRLDILDPALVRRFDEVIEIPAPTREQLDRLAHSLEARYDVRHVNISDCANFDAVTKRVLREARRQVMAEILEEERKQDAKKEG